MRFSWGWPDRGPCKIGPCLNFLIVAYILQSLTSNRRWNLGPGVNKVTWGRFYHSTWFALLVVIPLILHFLLSQRFRRAKGCAVVHVNRTSPNFWPLFKLFCLKYYTHSYSLPCVPHSLPFLSFWDDHSNNVAYHTLRSCFLNPVSSCLSHLNALLSALLSNILKQYFC